MFLILFFCPICVLFCVRMSCYISSLCSMYFISFTAVWCQCCYYSLAVSVMSVLLFFRHCHCYYSVTVNVLGTDDSWVVCLFVLEWKSRMTLSRWNTSTFRMARVFTWLGLEILVISGCVFSMWYCSCLHARLYVCLSHSLRRVLMLPVVDTCLDFKDIHPVKLDSCQDRAGRHSCVCIAPGYIVPNGLLISL